MDVHKVLILGSGGREHALACALLRSAVVKEVFVSPGNAGMTVASNITVVGDVNVHDHSSVIAWCRQHSISLVAVGPEDLLAEGISDSLTNAGIACFGPSALAARIESSKEFSKQFMSDFNIPTARWKSFTDSQKACEFIRSAEFKALVVKASGLAAGKGVIVAENTDEACTAAVDILQGKYDSAGNTIVVEELLEGEEVSCLAFSDGSSVVLMPPAQDHKRLLDGDKGPNTGGMGAYCPCSIVTDMEFVKASVIQKTVDGLRSLGCPFKGVLYAGLMLTKDGPKVLEFNCRFGDPETQVILPLLESDLFQIMLNCVEGKLLMTDVQFGKNLSAVGVVLASSGYPNEIDKGHTITGLNDAISQCNASIFCAGVSAGSNNDLINSGGRVLTVVVTGTSLQAAAFQAQQAANLITFTGRHFRTDISHKAFRQQGLTYESAGVSIAVGDSFVEKIKPFAQATKRIGCSADLGLFGGIFDMKSLGYVDPLLVTGTDGVGTKLQIARAVGVYNTVGIDLVAMSVNDVLCHGAEPVFFLDCFSCSKLDVNMACSVITGICSGCQMANCALIGGETAEMPGTYQSGEFEVSGFVVGVVERDKYLPKLDEIVDGDVVIGLPSSGVHSNGYSLVRAVVAQCNMFYDQPSPFESDKTLGQSLLTPTRIYVKNVLNVLRSGLIKAVAHITGGGLPGNIVRVLPEGISVQLDATQWQMPSVFGWLATMGNISATEMARTFNCGIGLVLITSKEHVCQVLQQLTADGEGQAAVIGSLIASHKVGNERVRVDGLDVALKNAFSVVKSNAGSLSNKCQKQVAVLISGTGTNLQALLDYTESKKETSSAKITLVISNVADAFGLKRAESVGIKTLIINHKEFSNREEFDAALHEKLLAENIDIICLAGFMRILSGGFVRKWHGKILNIHPSLLPMFKGAHAHRLALEAGVRVTGCTVHFVAEEVDAGAIVTQKAVPVMYGDTEETLSERVKLAEHQIFPEALELLASGKVEMSANGKVIWN